MRDTLYTIAVVSLTYLPLSVVVLYSTAIVSAYGMLGLALATIVGGVIGGCIFMSLFKLTKGTLK